MWCSKKSVKLSLIVCYVLVAVLMIFVFFGTNIFELYMTAYRGFEPDGEKLDFLLKVFVGCFYPCSVFAAGILYYLIKILRSIKVGDIFTQNNVKYLKLVSWFCFAIGIITFIGTFLYMPFCFIAAAGGFVGMLLRVCKNVMQSALEIKEENELTI